MPSEKRSVQYINVNMDSNRLHPEQGRSVSYVNHRFDSDDYKLEQGTTYYLVKENK